MRSLFSSVFKEVKYVTGLALTSRSKESERFTPLAPGTLQMVLWYRSHFDVILCVFLEVLHINIHSFWWWDILNLWSNRKNCEQFNHCWTSSKIEIITEATQIRWSYHCAACCPDEQLEELILYFQVVFVVRSLNMNDSLVRLLDESNVLHLRTLRFNCRDTTQRQQWGEQVYCAFPPVVLLVHTKGWWQLQ